jgi:Flp pilus assembly protein TadG
VDGNSSVTADRQSNERGVALLEFAFAAPIFFFVLLVSFQLALIVTQYYSVRNVTRDTARWLAINPDSTDAAVRAHALSVAMPMMDATGFTSVTASPGCTTLVGGKCMSRQTGDPISVTVQYDLASRLFLPPDFGLGGMRITFPTRLPAYTATAMVE